LSIVSRDGSIEHCWSVFGPCWTAGLIHRAIDDVNVGPSDP